MIEAIEKIMVERLEKGLGELVRTVASYGGELDADIAYTVRAVPAVWVTFGGSTIVTKGTSAQRHTSTGKFVVMVAARNLRSEESGRRGGVHRDEIGCYDIIYAVRRLLDGQGLGIGLQYGLQPKQIRTIYNNQNVGGSPLSVYAIEYDAVWSDVINLADGKYPLEITDANNPDHIFTKYRGKLSPPDPDLHTVKGTLNDPVTGAQSPINIFLQNP
ncbi:MAG: DUF1834 family protein [Gammaproteobacteria bacterium]|nr:DUF1834 family protein [Gammaproteobacteria bacterium]